MPSLTYTALIKMSQIGNIVSSPLPDREYIPAQPKAEQKTHKKLFKCKQCRRGWQNITGELIYYDSRIVGDEYKICPDCEAKNL